MHELAPGFANCHRIRVRYADTDQMGVVYYGNFLTFFEVGRTEYLRAAGTDYKSIEATRVTAAVIEARVRYVAPARFDDELLICTRVAEMGRLRFRFEYQIWRDVDGTLVASGHTEHVLLQHGSMRPVRVPDEIRDSIERFEAVARSAAPAAAPAAAR
jgi:acyl-CoA thioester hydrolase